MTQRVVASRGQDVRSIAVRDTPETDVVPVSPWLRDSYRIYRALRDEPFDRIVFPPTSLPYCSVRAKETGVAFGATELIVDGSPAQPTEPLTKHVLGEAVTARLAYDVVRQQLHKDTSSSPSVSVVVPVYERVDYLPQCMESLGRQTYGDVEVIVVDDGSTRPVRAPGATVLRVSHGGVAAARNHGAHAAAGELIVFLDDDDVAFPELVETLVRAKRVSSADIVAAGARVFHGDGPPQPHAGDRITIPFGNAEELGLLWNHYGHPTALWPRELFDEVGGFRELAVGEDWELLARAALAGARLTAPPDPLFWYRQGGGGRFAGVAGTDRASGEQAVGELYARHRPDDVRRLNELYDRRS